MESQFVWDALCMGKVSKLSGRPPLHPSLEGGHRRTHQSQRHRTHRCASQCDRDGAKPARTPDSTCAHTHRQRRVGATVGASAHIPVGAQIFTARGRERAEWWRGQWQYAPVTAWNSLQRRAQAPHVVSLITAVAYEHRPFIVARLTDQAVQVVPANTQRHKRATRGCGCACTLGLWVARAPISYPLGDARVAPTPLTVPVASLTR